jgi:predicted branched-subunit amino acid permease
VPVTSVPEQSGPKTFAVAFSHDDTLNPFAAKTEANLRLATLLYDSLTVTDEVFGVASSKKESIKPIYMYGLILLPFIGWSLGTLLGAMAGELLPEELRLSLTMMVYSMFIAVMMPSVKREKGVLLAILVAAALNCGFAFLPFFKGISEGFAIIICAVISAAVMALICPLPDEDEDGKDNPITESRGEGSA